MIKKVAILGKLPTKFDAPFDNPDWDIWAFNWHSDLFAEGESVSDTRLTQTGQDGTKRRVTKWFDIHAHGTNPKADITRANFPFKEVEELVGGQYFNNSVSYLIAYAILKGYKEIALYGMKFNAEHETRRNGEYQSVREMIFFSKGRGIKISAPADECLLREYPLYGV